MNFLLLSLTYCKAFCPGIEPQFLSLCFGALWSPSFAVLLQFFLAEFLISSQKLIVLCGILKTLEYLFYKKKASNTFQSMV